MFIKDTAANLHIIDGGNGASGENGSGSHSEAQDGTNDGETIPT